jgi:hypothetical protein
LQPDRFSLLAYKYSFYYIKVHFKSSFFSVWFTVPYCASVDGQRLSDLHWSVAFNECTELIARDNWFCCLCQQIGVDDRCRLLKFSVTFHQACQIFRKKHKVLLFLVNHVSLLSIETLDSKYNGITIITSSTQYSQKLPIWRRVFDPFKTC